MSNLFIEVVEDGILTENTTAQFYVATFTASADTFTELFDTPSTKVGAAGKLVQISDDESKLVYANVQNGLKSTEGVLELDIDGLPETDIHDQNMRIPVSDGITQQSIPLAGLATTFEAYGTSQVDFEARRAQNDEEFAASGSVHFGKARSGYAAINQGLYTSSELVPNILFLGENSSSPNPAAGQTSATNYALLNIAGVTHNTEYLNNTTPNSIIKFPEAPDGTVTYDSATGVTTQHASTAEAFEGVVVNGDLRAGNDGTWKNDGGILIISNGRLESQSSTISNVCAYQTAKENFVSGKSYRLKIKNLTNNQVCTVRLGNIYDSSEIIPIGVGQDVDKVIVSQTNLSVFNISGSGANAQIAFDSISIMPVTEEVVTERVDMWGFEAFLEEVNSTNSFVYPNGLIQSQATTMDGVTTSTSNRPDTYYAVFDGDTTSKGKGLDFFALSSGNSKKVLANHKHNLVFVPNVGLCQWRLRQRTIAGAGNGDFDRHGVIESNIPESAVLSFNKTIADGFVAAQGVNNSSPSYGTSNSAVYYTEMHVSGWNKETGAFKAGISNGATTAGVNGECHFLVCGTVNRLNQGAYHPSFNPLGVSWAITNNGASGGAWHKYPSVLTSTADCFNYYHATTNPTGTASAPSQGAIGGSQHGRPDSRAHNAIYEDGQGGVCRDMRYSANGIDPVDFDEADLRVKTGKYRGFEKRSWSFVLSATTSSVYYSASNIIKVTGYSDTSKVKGVVPVSATVTGWSGAVSIDGTIYKASNIYYSQSTNDWVFDLSNNPAQNFVGKTVQFAVLTQPLASSVGDSFLQNDVIGDPANILKIDALKNGWEGSWIPQLVQPSTILTAYLTRKCISSSLLDVWVTTDYTNWQALTKTIDSATNSKDVGGGATSNLNVYILHYHATAKITEPSTTVEVHGGQAGIGSVLATAYQLPQYGCLFAESLLGVIVKENFGNIFQQLSHYGVTLASAGGIWQEGLVAPQHIALSLSGSNLSVGCKALDYNVNINQQAFKQYAATELRHNGTNWGDDSKIKIVNGESTKTDLNGNNVKVVTHKLKEPIGWVKNKV